MASSVANEYGVRVTPTFLFFLDGKKVGRSFISVFDVLTVVRMPNSKARMLVS
jgi:hypothetical protein